MLLTKPFSSQKSYRKLQRKYNQVIPLRRPDYAREIVVDNFAGGGGASTGIEIAIGRSVDEAINHDPAAIAMHQANHPTSRHWCESVWDVDPRDVAAGRPVGLVWLSPDCKHFSKAKGATPVNKFIRGLAWVAVRWAATVRPRLIMLENVEEFKTWGPVVQDEEGNWYPDPKRKGHTFQSFVNALRRQGYAVEWRELKACDYGAPTVRKRLFLVARCDGQAIVWPEPTHAAPESLAVQAGKKQPYRTAADIIDWSIPCKSIFGRKRPLADNTLRRIARGIDKFIIQVANEGKTPFLAPFVMKINHQGEQFRGQAIDEPLQTITAKNGWSIVTPYITRIGQTGFGGDRLQYNLDDPLTTVTSKNEHLLVCPTLIQVGYGERKGQKPRALDFDKPLGTITAGGNKFAMAATFITKFRGTNVGQTAEEPLQTITAGGLHFGAVQAFLVQYNGSSIGQDVKEPLNTITTKDRFGLITIHGEDYQIVDIRMRMLKPRELFNANGFPSEYKIDKDPEGNNISQEAQVARCGNAVPPPFATALVRANVPDMCVGSGHALALERYQEVQEGQLAFSM